MTNSTQEKGYIEGNYRFFFLEDKMNQRIAYHFHDFHKCVIVYNGQVEYMVEGRNYQLEAGHMLLLPKHEMHQVYMPGSSPYRRCVIYLSDAFTESISKELIETLRLQTPIVRELSKNALELMPYEWRYSSSLKQLSGFLSLIDASLFGHTYESLKGSSVNEGAQHTTVVSKVINYIHEYYNQPLTVAEISSVVGFSGYHLMHLFKSETGITIHQYILKTRMLEARLLMKQKISLTEISYKVGFNNYTTFARTFKNNYGISPKAFMKQNPSEPMFYRE